MAYAINLEQAAFTFSRLVFYIHSCYSFCRSSEQDCQPPKYQKIELATGKWLEWFRDCQPLKYQMHLAPLRKADSHNGEQNKVQNLSQNWSWSVKWCFKYKKLTQQTWNIWMITNYWAQPNICNWVLKTFHINNSMWQKFFKWPMKNVARQNLIMRKSPKKKISKLSTVFPTEDKLNILEFPPLQQETVVQFSIKSGQCAGSFKMPITVHMLKMAQSIFQFTVDPLNIF